MHKIQYTLILLAVMCSCSHSGSDSGKAPTAVQVTDARLDAGELAAHEVPLPQIPDSITRPSQKADYMMLHFWDGMDFGDPSMVGDTLLVEQTFSNFIEILPRTSSEEALRKAVARMYEQASASPSAYSFMVSLADKYLRDPDSPFRNEALYCYFEEAERAISGR